MTNSLSMRTILSLFLGVTLAFSAAQAQTSSPLVVQAAGSATTPAQSASAVQAAPANAAAGQSTLKLLQEMKAANDETLRKQQAALQQLDEIQKAADQIRIYTKRS